MKPMANERGNINIEHEGPPPGSVSALRLSDGAEQLFDAQVGARVNANPDALARSSPVPLAKLGGADHEEAPITERLVERQVCDACACARHLECTGEGCRCPAPEHWPDA
jgi:hypothetical protein